MGETYTRTGYADVFDYLSRGLGRLPGLEDEEEEGFGVAPRFSGEPRELHENLNWIKAVMPAGESEPAATPATEDLSTEGGPLFEGASLTDRAKENFLANLPPTNPDDLPLRAPAAPVDEAENLPEYDLTDPVARAEGEFEPVKKGKYSWLQAIGSGMTAASKVLRGEDITPDDVAGIFHPNRTREEKRRDAVRRRAGEIGAEVNETNRKVKLVRDEDRQRREADRKAAESASKEERENRRLEIQEAGNAHRFEMARLQAEARNARDEQQRKQAEARMEQQRQRFKLTVEKYAQDEIAALERPTGTQSVVENERDIQNYNQKAAYYKAAQAEAEDKVQALSRKKNPTTEDKKALADAQAQVDAARSALAQAVGRRPSPKRVSRSVGGKRLSEAEKAQIRKQILARYGLSDDPADPAQPASTEPTRVDVPDDLRQKYAKGITQSQLRELAGKTRMTEAEVRKQLEAERIPILD